MATKIGFGGARERHLLGQRITVVPGRLALLAPMHDRLTLDSATRIYVPVARDLKVLATSCR